jgi:DNA-binding SARP family transcriptional activator
MHIHSNGHRCTGCRRTSTHEVAINVLGGFSVRVDGVLTPSHGWGRRTAAALVKILALNPGHRMHREQMMDLLWPDESPDRCAPRLHKAAHFARQSAGRHDAIVLQDDLVWLFPGATITVDALRFEALARVAVAENDAAVAREALDWYGGELLPQDRFEDWAADRRESLHLRRLDVLRVAGQWRDLAELDPTHEPAHVELMRQHLAVGHRLAAVQQYQRLERVLDRELGVAPGEPARRVLSQAAPSRVDELLSELAGLVSRQTAVLAELAASGTMSHERSPYFWPGNTSTSDGCHTGESPAASTLNP